MKVGKFSAVLTRALLALCCVVFMAQAQAAETLDGAMLDKWLATTNEFLPMQDVFKNISEESEIAQKYTEEEFKAMDAAKQDKLMDQLLKDEGVYDDIYAVLNKQDWPSAGSYMRISSRVATAIQVHMQNMMLKSLPAEQAQMVKEMMGGDVEADPKDVAIVSQNWSRISKFVGENFDSAMGAMSK